MSCDLERARLLALGHRTLGCTALGFTREERIDNI
jgi:hypothetical protein